MRAVILAGLTAVHFVVAVTASAQERPWIVVLKPETATMVFTASTVPAEPLFDPQLVSLKDGVAQIQSASTAQRLQAKLATGEVLESVPRDVRPQRVYDAVFIGFAALLTDAEVQILRAHSLVSEVQADLILTIETECRDLGALPCSQNAPSLFPWGIGRVSRPEGAFTSTYFGQRSGMGVTAFVLDTGIRKSHREFPFGVSGWWSATPDYNDCNGHGTHVSSTITGRQYGVGRRVGLVPMVVLDCEGNGATQVIVNALDSVVRSVTENPGLWLPAVVNMSLGGSPNPVLDRAVERVIAAGVPVVVAAGNNNGNACDKSPARVPGAITVAASTYFDTPASFSNWGGCVDLYAPGLSIPAAGIADDDQIVYLNGTSMAAPHVAGVIALYLDQEALTPPTPVTWPATVAAITAAVLNNGWKNKLTGSLNGSPNVLLSSRWGDLAAPSCRDRVFTTADSPLQFYLSGYDCQMTPKGAGYYGASFTIPGTAGQEMELEAFGFRGFDADLTLLSPAGTVVAAGTRIVYTPPATGNHKLWVAGASPWATGDARISFRTPGAPDPLDTITGTIVTQPKFLVRDRGRFPVELRFVNAGPALQLFPLQLTIAGGGLSVTKLTQDGVACDLAQLRCIVNQWPTNGAVNIVAEVAALDSDPSSLVVARTIVDFQVFPIFERVFLGDDSAVSVPIGNHVPAETRDARAALDITLEDDVPEWVIDRIVLEGAPSSGNVVSASLQISAANEARPDEMSIECRYDAIAIPPDGIVFPNPPCRTMSRALWLSFDPRLDTAGAFWNWRVQNGTFGAPDLWRNPANGTGKNCRSWGTISKCFNTTKTDLGFRIDGWIDNSVGRSVGELTPGPEDLNIVAAVPAGNGYVIAYHGYTGSKLWLRRLDRAGNPIGGPLQVFDLVQAAHIGADSAGNILVAASIAPDPDSPSSLSVRSITANDVMQPPVEVTSIGSPGAPAVACHPNGSCLVAWLDNITTVPQIPQFRVAARAYNVNATPVGGPQTLSSLGSDGTGRLGIAAAGQGGFVTAWSRRGAIWSRFVSGDGAPGGQVLRVDRGAGNHSSPSVAALRDGTVAYAWRTFTGGGNTEVSLQVLDPSGGWCGADVLLRRPASGNQYAPGTSYGPVIALQRDPLNGAGSWTVAWLPDVSTSPYVFGRRGKGCTADPFPFYVAEAPGGFPRWSPVLAADGASLLAAWSTRRPGAPDPISWRFLPETKVVLNGVATSGRFTVQPADSNWRFVRPLVSDERWQFYRVDVPASATSLDVALDHVTHDAAANLDLYLWHNARPGAAAAQCRATAPGAMREACAIAASAPGTWWIGVNRAGADASSYRLTAQWR